MNARTREVLACLDLLADPSRRPGMARVGINVNRALGVSVPHLRRLARGYRADHPLALDLWRTGVHEARILASMVDDPAQVTPEQMEAWVVDFDSWDLCDQVCGNLFESAPSRYEDRSRLDARPEEFVKRAGFATGGRARGPRPDSPRPRLHGVVPRHPARRAPTTGNYVKKAVSWALRQHRKAEPRAQRRSHPGSRSAPGREDQERPVDRSRCAPRAHARGAPTSRSARRPSSARSIPPASRARPPSASARGPRR